ncbi:hypothetical protein CR513_53101, partial [Mucuna pruriens]
MDTSTPWFVDICNFIMASQFPPEASRLYKEKIKSDVKYYIWDDLYLWKRDNDQVIRRLQDQLSPPFLSCSGRRRPSWINLDSPKGTKLWVLLAHHFLRCPPICLGLRTMSKSRDGYEPPA